MTSTLVGAADTGVGGPVDRDLGFSMESVMPSGSLSASRRVRNTAEARNRNLAEAKEPWHGFPYLHRCIARREGTYGENTSQLEPMHCTQRRHLNHRILTLTIHNGVLTFIMDIVGIIVIVGIM